MPLNLPVLDNRRFDDLVAEARGLIPTYAPEWTNHNASDPGVTLVELFSHITEMLIYRLDRVTTANVASFLNLLDGTAGTPQARTAQSLQGKDLASEIRSAVQALRRLDRAVSAADFAALALQASETLPPNVHKVERARCVPRRNLVADLGRDRPGHVSVIVLPRPEDDLDPALVPEAALIEAVTTYLTTRTLLTTHVHVVGPFYVDVGVDVTVVLRPDVPAKDEQGKIPADEIADSVETFLSPHRGGDDERGWPFGRNVFVSELYARLDRLPVVDYVSAVDLSPAPTPPGRLIVGKEGAQIGVEVKPHELVQVVVSVNVLPA